MKTLSSRFAVLVAFALSTATAAGKEPPLVRLKVGSTYLSFPGPIYSTCISDDGRFVAGSSSRSIVIWDLVQNREHSRIRLDGTPRATPLTEALHLCFQDNGTILKAETRELSFQWNLTRKKIIAHHKHVIGSLGIHSYSLDNRWISQISERARFGVFDSKNNQLIEIANRLNGDITASAISPNGEICATGDAEGEIQLWDVLMRKKMRTFNAAAKVTGLAFLPKGSHLIWATNEGAITMAEIDGRKLHAKLRPQDEHRVWGIAVSPDGKWLAYSVTGNEFTLFNLETRQKSLTMNSFSSKLNQFSFSSNSKFLSAGSSDHTIRVIDLATCKLISKRTGHDGEIVSAYCDNPERPIISYGSDKKVIQWDQKKRTPMQAMMKLGENIKMGKLFLAFDKYYVTYTEYMDSGLVVLWDRDDLSKQRTININGYCQDVFDISRQGDLLAVAKADLNDFETSTVELIELKNEKNRKEVRMDFHRIKHIKFNPDRSKVLIRGLHKSVMIDVKSGNVDWSFRHNWNYLSLHAGLFVHSGKSIVLEYDGTDLCLRNAETGKMTKKIYNSRYGFGMPHETVKVIALSPDESQLAAATWDVESDRSRIEIWDVKTLTRKHLLPYIHEGDINSLSFSRDGKLLTSGGADSTCIVWDLTVLDKK